MFLGQFLSFEQWEEKEIKKFLEKELDTLSRDEKDQKIPQANTAKPTGNDNKGLILVFLLRD